MKNSFEGVNVIRTEHHELTPHEAALYLIFAEDVQVAVAEYQAVFPTDIPRDYTEKGNVQFRIRAEARLQAALLRNNITLKPVLAHGSDVSLEQFVAEFTAHRAPAG